MIAVCNISGWVKHVEIDMQTLRGGKIRLAVPKIFSYGEAPQNASLNCIEFYVKTYDKTNHIAYLEASSWV